MATFRCENWAHLSDYQIPILIIFEWLSNMVSHSRKNFVIFFFPSPYKSSKYMVLSKIKCVSERSLNCLGTYFSLTKATQNQLTKAICCHISSSYSGISQKWFESLPCPNQGFWEKFVFFPVKLDMFRYNFRRIIYWASKSFDIDEFKYWKLYL